MILELRLLPAARALTQASVLLAISLGKQFRFVEPSAFSTFFVSSLQS